MVTTKGPVVVLGAGMTGLLAAFLVKKHRPEAEVTIVERSDRAGAEYREWELEGFGRCDNAMRLLYETGIADVDETLHGFLPEKDWHVLPGNRKDIVGAYWRGRLQTNSGYLDLRRLDGDSFRQCEQEILERARKDEIFTNVSDAALHLASRFGPTTASYLARVLRKLHHLPADALHRSATAQPAMDRVILYDEDRMQPVFEDERLRAVIAWPEQLTFPLERNPPQAGLYPRRFGMNRVVDAAVQQLERKGVRFLFNRTAASVGTAGDRVAEVVLDDGSAIEHPELVVGANGLPATAGLLREPGTLPRAGPRPPRSWLVFFRTRELPDMGNLYYFWCFDEPHETFRVTHYANYCPAARNKAGYPICVELWSADDDASQATTRAVRELREMNVLEDEEAITARAAVPTANLHALNTLECVQQIQVLRDEVEARRPRNMIAAGPFMEDGVVLLYEIWRRMYPLIMERL